MSGRSKQKNQLHPYISVWVKQVLEELCSEILRINGIYIIFFLGGGTLLPGYKDLESKSNFCQFVYLLPLRFPPSPPLFQGVWHRFLKEIGRRGEGVPLSPAKYQSINQSNLFTRKILQKLEEKAQLDIFPEKYKLTEVVFNWFPISRV